MNQFLNLGHWNFNQEFNPDDFVGFVYQITNKITGQKYIGKKFFRNTVRRPVAHRKNKKRIIKESNWKEYTGSSKKLNEDIAKIGKENFEFQILSLHESKGTLAYTEVEQILTRNTLREKLPNGLKAYYNALIPPIKFIPGDETDIEKKYKI